MASVSWITYLKGFKSWLRLERGLSINTISAYSSDIELMAQYLEEELGRLKPNDVKTDDLRKYISFMAQNGVKERSQARVMSSIRQFYRFLEDEIKGLDNPTESLESPRLGRYLPDVLGVDDIEKMLAMIDRSKPEGERNRAMLEVLFACGLRVSELVNLRFQDLFLDQEVIRVLGKGNKERLVPIGGSAIHHLKIYIEHIRRKQEAAKGHDVYVFLNKNGRKLSRQMIFLIVRDLAARAGIKKHISPHTFRHSFATALVDADANLRAVQQMLGHESITTTEIYTHLSREKLRDTLLKHHPRAKK